MSAARPLRVAVYADNWYRPTPDGVYADRSLVLFIAGVAAAAEHTILLGQLDPDLPRAHYRVPDHLDFVGLPSYSSMLSLKAPLAMLRSLGRFWRVLSQVDVVWLLGPHPLCLAFALLAALRRKRIALGVRQDFPTYVRTRHPGKRLVHLLGDLLEGSYRLIARRAPTVVVGPELAENFRRARWLLSISVSLVRDSDIADPDVAAARPWDGEQSVLSVGRLETEKNPLLLADILAKLAGDGDWKLLICGEGPLEGELRERLRSHGVEQRAELLGYLPIHGGLMDRYRSVNAFLHVSWTEGMPQVLLEAFAAGTPVVATAVGGVPEAAGDAALLIPPGDADAAATALERIAAEPELRRELVRRGVERVRGRTLEAESARVARFLADPAGSVQTR
ncbi:MAG TPA: glycosyltransferase [Thermoleophilaceae bacterium]|nr:glycosyltransferase [Thermoleophilaceae bacterium]